VQVTPITEETQNNHMLDDKVTFGSKEIKILIKKLLKFGTK